MHVGEVVGAYIAHFYSKLSLLVKAGWESMQDREFVAQVATELF